MAKYKKPRPPEPIKNEKFSEEPRYPFDLLDARDFILACLNEAESEYREIHKIWAECWNMYINYEDHSNKAEWQSKVFLPEINPAIKKAVSLLVRILLRARRIFDLKDPLNEGIDSPEIQGQEHCLDYWLNAINWQRLLKLSIESGFVFGVGVIKLWWEPVWKTAVEITKQTKIEEREDGTIETFIEVGIDKVSYQSSSLAGSIVDPRKIHFNHNRDFIIEESYTTLPALLELCKPGPNGEKPLYDKEQVMKMKGIDYAKDSREIERLKSLKIISSSNPFRPTVHLLEFWGDQYDREGNIIKKNAHLVLANKEYAINPDRTEQPYNFYGLLEGKPPYIIDSPLDLLFRENVGQSMAEGATSLQKAINKITNMSLDGLLWKLNKMFQFDPDLVRDPNALKAIRPGRPILTRGNEPVVKEIQVSDVPSGAMAEIEILRRALQNSTGVTDFLLALGAKSDTTATEVQVKTQESNSLFEGIGRNIEDNKIVPFVEMTRQLCVMNWDDFRDPILVEIAQKYGLPFMASTREERVAFLLKNVKIRSRGVSSYFEKMEELKTLIDFMGVFAKIPPMYKRLELRELADRIIGYFSFNDPQKLLITQEKEAELQKAEIEQEMAKTQNLQSQVIANQAKGQGAGIPMDGGNGGGLPPAIPVPGQDGAGPQPGQEQLIQALVAMGGAQ